MATPWPNWIDLVVLTIFLRTCYIGFSRGIESELFKLIGAISSTALACNFHTPLASALSPWWRWDPASLDFLAFLMILVVVGFLIRFVLGKLAHVFKWERLPWIIQGIGLMLGGIRGLWWAGVLLALGMATGMSGLHYAIQERSLSGARLVSMTSQALSTVADWYPGRDRRGSLLPSAQWQLPTAPLPKPAFPASRRTGQR